MRKSTKRRVSHLGLYGILLAVILLIGFSADWKAIKENFFDPEGFGRPWQGDWGLWPDLVTTGVKNTILYTAIAFVCGIVLGLLLALMRLSSVAGYRWIATAFVEFFRGLPALLVILVMAFGVPIAFSWTPPGGTLGAGLIGLILVASAYMSETLRAGIQAVPPGQIEAARSLGMGSTRTLFTVVLPQAVRIIIPPLTNEFVLLIKDTALLSVAVGLPEQRDLTAVARDFTSSGPTAQTSTTLIMAAILYMVITIPLTQLVSWMERRQKRAR